MKGKPSRVLYYYGARFYNPKTSIWLSVDPKGYAFPNFSPYNFMMGNPINVIDPGGDSAWTLNVETGELTNVDDRGGTNLQIVEFVNNEGHHLGEQIVDGEHFYYNSSSEGYIASKFDL